MGKNQIEASRSNPEASCNSEDSQMLQSEIQRLEQTRLHYSTHDRCKTMRRTKSID